MLAKSVVGLLLTAQFLALGQGSAAAQSPSPSYTFKSAQPGDPLNTSWNGVVVYGLGLGSCDSISALKSRIVADLAGQLPVIAEISPQSGCDTIAHFKNDVASIDTYVRNNVSATIRRNYWWGFMLDEETNFGYTPSALENLNGYVQTYLAPLDGSAWLYTELFTATGGWTEGQYNALVDQSFATPQVPNSNMVTVVNSSAYSVNIVTWSTGYPAPYNTKAASVGAINGSPRFLGPAHDGNSHYWSNRFRAGGC